jgi:hypothetical protein
MEQKKFNYNYIFSSNYHSPSSLSNKGQDRVERTGTTRSTGCVCVCVCVCVCASVCASVCVSVCVCAVSVKLQSCQTACWLLEVFMCIAYFSPIYLLNSVCFLFLFRFVSSKKIVRYSVLFMKKKKYKK